MYEKWNEIMISFSLYVKKHYSEQADELINELSNMYRIVGQLDQDQYISLWNEITGATLFKKNHLIGQEYIAAAQKLVAFIRKYMNMDND